MNLRRLAAFLIGAWLAGSVFMSLVATQNFRSVDRLLERPSARASQVIEKLGPEDARALLRHQVSEQNRWYFETWETAQLVLGAVLLIVLWRDRENGRNSPVVLGALMLATVAIMHWFVTPVIVTLGRELDFIPKIQSSPERARFWSYHVAYSVAELFKLALGIALAVMLLKTGRDKRALAQETGAALRRQG